MHAPCLPSWLTTPQLERPSSPIPIQGIQMQREQAAHGEAQIDPREQEGATRPRVFQEDLLLKEKTPTSVGTRIL